MEWHGRLGGNPVCKAEYLFRPDQACDGLGASKSSWAYVVGGNSCGEQSCSGSKVANLRNSGNCKCVEPFKIEMECRRPTFSVITNALMDSLWTSLSKQLGLLPQQVFVVSAHFTADNRALIDISFFNADGQSALDRDSMTNITHAFANQELVLPEFKPYIASHVVTAGELRTCPLPSSL